MRQRDRIALADAFRAISKHIRSSRRQLADQEKRIAFLERELDATIVQVKMLIEKQSR